MLKYFRNVICGAIAGLCLIAQPASADNLIGDSAVLRALDKVTAETQDFTVQIGDTLQFGSLEIAVQHCEKEPPEETPETYVFVQIDDLGVDFKVSDDREAERIFSGWMFGSNPALSALEHPVYDVWPIGCNARPQGLRGFD